MPKVEIEVDQILTAAVGLDVEPGDRLLVMNGIIIGMVERRAGRPPAAAPVEAGTPAPHARPAPAKPAKSPKPRKKRKSLPPWGGASRLATHEQVLDVLAVADTPLTGRQIGIAIKLAAHLPRAPHVRAAVDELRTSGQIEPTDDSLRPPYRLTNRAGATPP